jgi:hypothetical protein
MWPDDEPQERRLAEGRAMAGTAMVPRQNGDRPDGPAPIDEQLAGQLRGRFAAPIEHPASR